MKYYHTLKSYIDLGNIKNYITEQHQGVLSLEFPDEGLWYFFEYKFNEELFEGGSDEYGRLESYTLLKVDLDFCQVSDMHGDPLEVFEDQDFADLLQQILEL